jgi:hypothetical protein
MIKPNAIPRLRAAAALRQALVERDAVRQGASNAEPADVAVRLRAGHAVHMAARGLVDVYGSRSGRSATSAQVSDNTTIHLYSGDRTAVAQELPV